MIGDMTFRGETEMVSVEHGMECNGGGQMIKAVVFDAYGTLFDVQSVAGVVSQSFPDHSAYITQVWRLKQLEYSWARSMMGRYEDFWTVTRESLAYTLRTLGLEPSPAVFDAIAESYNALSPYRDARDTLERLAGRKRAILSNGSPAMLSALVSHSGLGDFLDATISVDPKRVFKPDHRAYELVEDVLGVSPDTVMFVSSNGFDVSGAKSFGFRVARIARASPDDLAAELRGATPIGPDAMFKALRNQPETYGPQADIVVSSLSDLVDLI